MVMTEAVQKELRELGVKLFTPMNGNVGIDVSEISRLEPELEKRGLFPNGRHSKTMVLYGYEGKRPRKKINPIKGLNTDPGGRYDSGLTLTGLANQPRGWGFPQTK